MEGAGPPHVVLDVEGMMCQKSCGTTVEGALSSVGGVAVARASFPEKRAFAWLMDPHVNAFDENIAAKLVAAVEAVGFDAALSTQGPHKFTVEGMMCQNSCASTVRAAVEGVAGVTHALVSHPAKAALVWGNFSDESVIAAVQAVGFDASRATDASSRESGGGAGGRTGTYYELNVEGMMCQNSCASTVRGALESLPHVERAEVSHPDKLAKVWTQVPVDVGQLIYVVNAVGFDATAASGDTQKKHTLVAPAAVGTATEGNATAAHHAAFNTKAHIEASLEVGSQQNSAVVSLAVGGMSCASCVRKIESALGKMDGITQAAVNLSTARARVIIDTSEPTHVSACMVESMCASVPLYVCVCVCALHLTRGGSRGIRFAWRVPTAPTRGNRACN